MKANDPKTYRKMIEPLGDKEAANARLEEFGKEVEALRLKHHLLNLVFITDTIYADGEDEESMVASVRFGDDLRCTLLVRHLLDAMTNNLARHTS